VLLPIYILLILLYLLYSLDMHSAITVVNSMKKYQSKTMRVAVSIRLAFFLYVNMPETKQTWQWLNG